jgi:hypothetical protein
MKVHNKMFPSEKMSTHCLTKAAAGGRRTEMTNFYLQHAVRLILWSVCQKALAIVVQILTYFSTHQRK